MTSTIRADRLNERDRLKAINAELLRALKHLHRVAKVELYESRPDVIEEARAAIAQATQG